MKSTQKLIKLGLVTAIAVASVGIAEQAVQAASLGSIGITGVAGISENGGTTTIDLSSVNEIDPDATTGQFEQYDGTTPTVQNLTLTQVGTTNIYEYGDINNFYTLDDGSGNITNFTLGAGQATRTEDGGTIEYDFRTFEGEYSGFIEASGAGTLSAFESSGVGSFAIVQSAQVPEPMTILGTGFALGFAALFKKNFKK